MNATPKKVRRTPSNATVRLEFMAGLLFACTVSPQALACAVCFGDPNSSQTHGMNWAILTMLGFIAVVFAGLGAFAITLWRRAQVSETEPAAEALSLDELVNAGYPAL
jgi:heme/copper-type cytochrome/quinol oxidase subunit 2